MNDMLPPPSATRAPQSSLSIDELLRQRRVTAQKARPSDGFWENTFAPRFARKMMAALGRPRHTGRTLTIVGWTTPFVVTALFALALGVAYFFSPQRAIARWEAQATRKDYVTGALSPASQTGRGYQVDAASEVLASQRTSPVGEVYRLTSAEAGAGVLPSQF